MKEQKTLGIFTMSAVASNGFFALKDETTSLAELREFFESKQYKLPSSPKSESGVGGSENELFTTVKHMLVAAEHLAPLLGERELELVLNAILNLSVTFTREQTSEFVEAICASTHSDTFKGRGWHSHAAVAIRFLTNLFHLYPDRPEVRFIVYKRLLELAGLAHVTRFIDTSLEQTERYANEWSLNVEQKRELLRTLHNTLIEDDHVDSAFKVMTALLRTYTDVDADRAKEDARECVRTAIVDPKSFSVDHLLRLTAVRRLQETDPTLHQVLTLFSTGQLADYRAFIKANPEFVHEQLRVDESMLEKKIKMLSLISLAERSKVISMTKLANELDVAEGEELEEFLIDAIGIKAINGKIDEQRNEFIVSAFEYRTFARPHWELLQKRLSALLKNMKRSHDNFDHLIAGASN